MKICAQVFFVSTCLHFIKQMSKKAAVGSADKCRFNFIRKCQSVFWEVLRGVSCLSFHSHQILLSNSPSLHPQHSELSHFIFTIVICVWYLCPTVASFCISLMANDIVHLVGLFAMCVSYLVKYLFRSLVHFWIVCLILFTVESWEFYIFPRFCPLMALCLLPVCEKLMLRFPFCPVGIQLLQTIGWTLYSSSTESLLHICQQSFGLLYQSGSNQEIETKQ